MDELFWVQIWVRPLLPETSVTAGVAHFGALDIPRVTGARTRRASLSVGPQTDPRSRAPSESGGDESARRMHPSRLDYGVAAIPGVRSLLVGSRSDTGPFVTHGPLIEGGMWTTGMGSG